MVAGKTLGSLNLAVTPGVAEATMNLSRILLLLLVLALGAAMFWELPTEPVVESLGPAVEPQVAVDLAGRPELRQVSREEGDALLESLGGESGIGAEDSPPSGRRRALAELADRFDELPLPPEPGDYDGALVREFTADGRPLFEVEQSQREDGVWVADGSWTSWHENGQVLEVGQYAMGVETGDWSWFDDNGQRIAMGSFVDGEREGAWTFWYSGGVKQMDARYEGGQGAGNWALYYEDGSPWAEGRYADGEISGYWTIWDEFGAVNPERTGFYEHGQRVSD